MLELPKFWSHDHICNIIFESHDKILLVTSWTEIFAFLIQNTFILRRRRVATFADIIKFATIFLKKLLKTQQK